ncbi:hypothetical protein EV421DRAFT_2023516 [Armillaria borealis]|uniref:Uncharacterized protein n=1 Tax=Armillaria borealis TaxID=47425 RepID=A0AA39MGY4_9AGAR|nr:hypothetical protein EV421DRAFT_2023516 [Armillaria borealis]
MAFFYPMIPREVIVAPGTSPYLTAEDIGPFRLRPPFHEMYVLADIQYTLVASIKRLGRLRGNAKIYVPMIRPGPPTILCQLAYQENSPLPGPEVDPEGWQQLPPALLKGTVFKDQEVEIQCTGYLYHDKSSYATLEGRLFHVHIAIVKCSDQQALDLLGTPSNVPMRLRWSVIGWKPDLPSYSSRNAIQDFGSYVWWNSGDQGTCRRLEGEIKLWEGLKLTCDFGNFKVQNKVRSLWSRRSRLAQFMLQVLDPYSVLLTTGLDETPFGQLS